MKIFATFLILVLILAFGCTTSEHKLKIAATSTPHLIMLEEIQEDLKKEGIELELIAVDDYQTPNRALNDGDVDANFFQHIPFLQLQVAQFGYNIENAGAIHIEPMGAYSKAIQDIDQLPKEAHILLPSDPSNQARALLLLKNAGLIELKDTPMPTIFHVKDSPYTFSEIDAALMPRVLDDADLALIPTNFALQAGLNPEIDALIIEDRSSPWANILATRKGEAQREDIKKLIEALKSDKMKAFVKEKFCGSIYIVD